MIPRTILLDYDVDHLLSLGHGYRHPRNCSRSRLKDLLGRCRKLDGQLAVCPLSILCTSLSSSISLSFLPTSPWCFVASSSQSCRASLTSRHRSQIHPPKRNTPLHPHNLPNPTSPRQYLLFLHNLIHTHRPRNELYNPIHPRTSIYGLHV
jgi:hypothetical protein